MRIEFDNYKDNLFAAALAVHCEEHFLEIVQQLHDQGYTKMAIYELFLHFHQEIQIDSRTKDKEFVYDNLSDFMALYAPIRFLKCEIIFFLYIFSRCRHNHSRNPKQKNIIWCILLMILHPLNISGYCGSFGKGEFMKLTQKK